MTGALASFVRYARVATLAAIAFAASAAAQSEGEDAGSRLELSLNTVDTTEAAGCRLTFVIGNELGAEIDKMVAEAVLFDTAGRVATMTLFDFGRLPEGRPRVRRFELAEQSCDGIGRLLINGIDTCEGEGLAPEACLDGLRLSTGTDIEVIG